METNSNFSMLTRRVTWMLPSWNMRPSMRRGCPLTEQITGMRTCSTGNEDGNTLVESSMTMMATPPAEMGFPARMYGIAEATVVRTTPLDDDPNWDNSNCGSGLSPQTKIPVSIRRVWGSSLRSPCLPLPWPLPLLTCFCCLVPIGSPCLVFLAITAWSSEGMTSCNTGTTRFAWDLSSFQGKVDAMILAKVATPSDFAIWSLLTSSWSSGTPCSWSKIRNGIFHVSSPWPQIQGRGVCKGNACWKASRKTLCNVCKVPRVSGKATECKTESIKWMAIAPQQVVTANGSWTNWMGWQTHSHNLATVVCKACNATDKVKAWPQVVACNSDPCLFQTMGYQCPSITTAVMITAWTGRRSV